MFASNINKNAYTFMSWPDAREHAAAGLKRSYAVK
jgi:hypothetical protein